LRHERGFLFVGLLIDLFGALEQTDEDLRAIIVSKCLEGVCAEVVFKSLHANFDAGHVVLTSDSSFLRG
jgi:hypothetical protein